MIGKLTGILSDKNPPQVLVDCGGVGYEVQVPMAKRLQMSSFCRMAWEAMGISLKVVWGA